MHKITLFSNNCPSCRLLKDYLDKHNVDYEYNNDVELMIERGFTSVPVLEIDDKIYDKLDTAMMAVKEMSTNE